MKLHIENFAKIKDIMIELKGLTIIAGNNNTGKSTIGKVLYSIFRGLSNIDARIKKDIRDTVRNAFINTFKNLAIDEKDVEAIIDGEATPEDVFRSSFLKSAGGAEVTAAQLAAVSDLYMPAIRERISQAMSLPPEETAKEILLKVFKCVFHNQFHPLKVDAPHALIEFTIKGETNRLAFGSERWGRAIVTKLFSKAYYITNPDILNLLNDREFAANEAIFSRSLDKYSFELARKLCEDVSSVSNTDRAIDDARLRPIIADLDAVIKGQVSKDAASDMSLTEEGNSEPTKFGNLSMGLKSFVLLRMMLERHILSDRDVLILDEPEIHLHPEWQVAYAKAIVRLQQVYGLTVLITTHSPFFVNALQRFCITVGNPDDTNFYLSRRDEKHSGYCVFDALEHKTGAIFKTFNHAYDAIEPSCYPEGL